MTPIGGGPATPLQLDGLLPGGTRVDVFQNIYWVFLLVGTLVGVVVIAYMLYNAYKYRDDGGEDDDVDRPTLGELPEGGGKGKKLFLSFALSAIIVVSLIVWTYAMLLYVEAGDNAAAGSNAPVTNGDDGANAGEEALTVHVEGYQFGWQYTYPNGHNTTTLYIPEDRRIRLNVTSRDVMHNYGIPAFRAKTDAIPGQYTHTWFVANETGTYQAQCYELCGSGHSYMVTDVEVMTQSAYQEWYGNTTGTNASSGAGNDNGDNGHSRVQP